MRENEPNKAGASVSADTIIKRHVMPAARPQKHYIKKRKKFFFFWN